MSVHCSGLTCQNKVEKQGQYCSSCWPQTDTPENMRQLKLDICHAGYKLAFGTRKEVSEAQENITFLINVLNHESMKATERT